MVSLRPPLRQSGRWAHSPRRAKLQFADEAQRKIWLRHSGLSWKRRASLCWDHHLSEPPALIPGVNPKGAGRNGALLRDVYGDLTPKEKCTCRVRAHGGG